MPATGAHTDRLLADLCVALYAFGAVPPPDTLPWEHVDLGKDDGVAWGYRRLDTADTVILRGSVTVADWIHDGMAIAEPIDHYALGPLHRGFAHGMAQMWEECRRMLRQDYPILIGGHSLGAARASILTGMMIVDGLSPDASVRFGEPCPGFSELGTYLERAGIYQRSYRNAGAWGHDYVTDVPIKLPDFPYVHPVPLVDVDQRPTGDLLARFGLFAGHHCPLYAAAMAAADQPEEKAA